MRRLRGWAPVMQGDALGPRREISAGCRGALSAVGEPAQAWSKIESDGGTAAEEPRYALVAPREARSVGIKSHRGKVVAVTQGYAQQVQVPPDDRL
jgi:hypothetical protein